MTLIRNRQPVQTVPKQRPKVQCTIWTLGGSAKMPLICFSIAPQRFKVFRFQSAPSQASFSVLPMSKTLFHTCLYPKHPFKLVCTQSVSRVRPNLKRPLRDCLHPGHSFALAEPKATLRVDPYPNHPLEPACAQSPSCPPESKAALRGCLNPRPPSRLLASKATHVIPGPKIPLVSARV